MKIIVLGYMASGKSTIGKALADYLHIDFKDLDDEISNRVGLDIPTIFSERGEIFFRKKESEILTSILENDDNFVLSLGGGTPCYGENMRIITRYTSLSFYLKLSIANLVERLIKQKDNRPLVQNINNDDLPEFVGKHLFERSAYYNLANHTINADNKSIAALVHEINGFLI